MRLLLLVLALAGPPEGFRESARLGPIASAVAGAPAAVYCARTTPAWAAQIAATGGGDPRLIGGYAMVAESAMHLSPWTCRQLEGWLRGKSVPTLAQFAGSTLLLVHEAIHLRGTTDESVTQCTALRDLPGVLTRRFGVKRAKTRRAIMAAAWRLHRSSPAEYRRLC